MIDLKIMGLNNAEKRLTRLKNKLPLVVARSINRTAPQFKAKAISTITKIYNIKRKNIAQKKFYKFLKASSSNLVAKYLITSYRFNLISFTTSWGKDWRSGRQRSQTKVGVKVKILKSKRYKAIPHSFISPGRYHKGGIVYMRAKGGNTKTGLVGRSPIIGLKGLSLPRMFNDKKVNKIAMAYYKKQFAKNYQNQLKYVLR